MPHVTPLLALAAVAAATGAAAASSPKLCLAMEKGRYFPAVMLTEEHHVSFGGGASVRCEWTSKPKRGQALPDHAVVLSVSRSRTIAAAKARLALTGSQGKRTRIRGADEAFSRTEDSGKASATGVSWRRGRYTGFFSISGPGDWGDLESARDLLEPFFAQLPRS